MAARTMTTGAAKERRKTKHFLREWEVRAQLGFRSSPEKRPGEKHPNAWRVRVYDEKYVEAIGVGMPLVDALWYAKDAAQKEG